jgi:hypothetical protein
MKLRLWLITTILIGWWTFLRSQEANPTLTRTESQTGLYFDEMGQLFLYTAQWKIVSYTNLKPTQLLWRQVKEHQQKISEFCTKVSNETWYHLTDCHAFSPCQIQSEICS